MANQNGIFRKKVDEKNFTVSAVTQDFTMDQGYPIGGIRRMWLRIFSSDLALGGGAAVTDGEKKFLRSLYVESTLHGPIYVNVDGIGLYRIMTMLLGKAPAQVTPAANTFSCLFHIPFGFLGMLRHPSKRLNDTWLWARTAKITTKFTIGVLTDLVAGGAPTATGKARMIAEYEPDPNPAPADQGGDKPGLQLEIVRVNHAALSTSGVCEQRLPIGQGRQLLYVVLAERGAADAEASNIFTANTSVVELRHGSDVIFERTNITDLDAQVADECDIALPAGYHLLPIVHDGKLTDARSLDPVQELILSVDNLANTTGLAIYLIYGKPVRAGAEPEAQR